MNILIIRNDKLGDFVLTLPCYVLLKATIPNAQISVLVPEYTADIARCSPFIDQIIIDTGDHSVTGLSKLVKELRTHQFDVVITLFSTTRTGLAALLAGIKYRLAPATKIAQIFYNHRLTQRRSRSEKPEYVYNLDLVHKFLSDHDIYSIPDPVPPYMSFDTKSVNSMREEFCIQYRIDKNKKLIFLHAGSGGSANNLSIEQYAQLTHSLDSENRHTFVLMAGPDEEERVMALSRQIDNTGHIVYHSTKGLVNFAQHIAFADLFISGSTGTLHIAGALDVPTAAFYTRRRSATPLRWQTLNSPHRRLAFTPPDDAENEDMSTVDIDAAATAIREKFLSD